MQRYGVAYVYQHWSYMPSLAEQHQCMEFTAPPEVVLMRPQRSERSPIRKLSGNSQMRREMVDLVRKAMAENRRAYVLVNNRSEENAPLTVQALAEMLRI